MKIILFMFSVLFCSTGFSEGYTSNAEAEVDAIRAISEATYKQTGIEKMLTEYVEKNIPDEYKPALSKLTTVTRILVTKKAEFVWHFQ